MKDKSILCSALALAGTLSALAQQPSKIVSYLEIYDCETGTHQVLKEFPYLIEAPNWTPDGKWLVVNKNGRLHKTASDGSTDLIEIETGKLAKQADGSVVVKMGGTMLLATVCCAKEAKEDVDFMPLSVEYKEKFASAGRFPGGFTRREGKASDYEILIARLIDRALRPLFPSNYHADTFVNVTLYSADGIDMPESIAGLITS